jgi:hypothetical protein
VTGGDRQNPRSEAKGYSRMTSGGYSRRDIWAGRLYAVRLAAALLRKRFQRVGRNSRPESSKRVNAADRSAGSQTTPSATRRACNSSSP